MLLFGALAQVSPGGPAGGGEVGRTGIQVGKVWTETRVTQGCRSVCVWECGSVCCLGVGKWS